MEATTFLLVSLAVFLALLLWYTRYMSAQHGVFRKIGIKGPAPLPIMGNFITESKKGVFGYHVELYSKHKADKVYGFYRVKFPILSVCDLDLVRDIMVKKFSSFVNRAPFFTDPPFDHALTMIKDDHWKTVRTSMSPAFSTSKLRRMYTHVKRTTQTLVDNLTEKMERNEPVELRDLLSCYTMDVIASTGFGYEVNSLKDKTNPFLNAGKKIMDNIGKFIIFGFFLDFLQPVLSKLGIEVFPKDASKFFMDFVDKAVAERQQDLSAGGKTSKHDFLQLFIESEKGGVGDNDNMTAEEAEALNVQKGETRGKLTRMDIQGQAFIFILAGYDTTSIAMSFTAFLLAMNPECCRKVQEEIDDQLQGAFPDYDNVQKLTYLDMCLNESMRLYPPGFLIDRVTSEEVELGGFHLPKGLIIQIPVCAIHRDPDLWPNPEEFIPERFTPENKATRHPYAHLPFGQGPRNCIGMRLALLEIKVGLCAMLQKMTPVACDKSVYPAKLDPYRMMAEDGLWVKLEPRN